MDGSFEAQTSERQDLTFDYAAGRLQDLLPGPGMLVGPDGLYTNFAYMLSDQFRPAIRLCSVLDCLYCGGGSLLEQFDSVTERLECMDTRSFMKGHTCSMRKFPLTGIREALLNAMIHSDLSCGGMVNVDVSGEYLTVTSPGGLWMVSGGISPVPRNRCLAELLMKEGSVSLSMRGVKAIRDSYRSTGILPDISSDDSSFTVTLPAFTRESGTFSLRRKKMLDFLDAHRGCDINTLCRGLHTTLPYTRNLLLRL